MKNAFYFMLIVLFASCGGSHGNHSYTQKKRVISNKTTTKTTTVTKSGSNKVEHNSQNTNYVGSQTQEIIFNGENNELIFEHINSMFTSNASHVVYIIDGDNNTITFTTKASVVNIDQISDTFRLTGNSNSLEFMRVFVLENHAIADKLEIISDMEVMEFEHFNEFENVDTVNIVNKFTSIYEPADDVIAKYENASKSGNLEAKYYLGEIYLNGIGTKKNLTKAKLKLFEAAQNGHVDAMNLLGFVYEIEELNKSEALKWYYKAADYGHSAAMERIEFLESGNN